MPAALETLTATISRINQLASEDSRIKGSLGTARKIPDWREEKIQGVYLAGSDYSASAAVTAIKETLKATERANGEKEMRVRLIEISMELEALRAVVPGLAAKATIEVGAIARAIAAEAEEE